MSQTTEPLLSNVPDLQNDNATTTTTTTTPAPAPAPATNTATNTNTESPSRFEFLKKAREFREEKLAKLRPLNDFFDKNRFSFTTSIAEITKRWK